MRLHRFFTGVDLSQPVITIDDGDLCHQWANVLRLKKGDQVIICDGKSNECTAIIEDLSAKRATLQSGAVRIVETESARHVILACAVLKRENFELVVQKATEAGVAEIIPLITARTIKMGLKMDRLQRIAKEAAEQSGRGVIPIIQEPIDFATFIKKNPADTSVIFFACDGKDAGWKSKIDEAKNVICIIGPEGGWTEEEVTSAKEHGCIDGSLGALVLRAETAAIVATYLAGSPA